MAEFTEEFIAKARKLLTENPWKHSIIMPVQLEMLDHIERLQARVAELEAEQEQVCEWVDPTNNPYGDLYIPLCNEDKIFEIESINEYHYCPNCGRRIKYTGS